MPYDCHKWSGLKYVSEVDLKDCFNGPEKTAAIFAPEVAAAFKNIFSDPANIMKYQSNPKVMALPRWDWRHWRYAWRNEICIVVFNLLVVIPQVNKCFEFGDVLLGMISWSGILLFPQKLLAGLLLKLM